MKKWMALALVLLLSGCGGQDPAMAQTLALRGSVLGAESVTFRAEITAHYIDTREAFTLECGADAEGVISFQAAEPAEIAGITGTVSGEAGALTFDNTVLAFPLTAEGTLSPVSGPWVMLKALRSGCIISAVEEGELLHMTIDDSYADDALTVDIWAKDGVVLSAEISSSGRRCLVLQIENFTLV